VISPDGSKILFVQSYEHADCLALVDAQGVDFPVKLAQGADFYMQPVWHPNGRHITWIEWNHPQMPWDGTRLMTARLDGTALTNIRCIVGDADTPIFQPEFSPDGRWLSYIAQDGEWDRLYILDLTNGKRRALVEDAALLPPAWIQGLRTYAWSFDSTRLFCLRNDRGVRALWSVGAVSGAPEKMDVSPYTWLEQISAGAGNTLAFLASSPQIPEHIVTWENGSTRVERYSESGAILPEDLPTCQPISWQAPDKTTVHGLYYPPASRGFAGDGLPPAIVHIHGGPTSAADTGFNTDVAFFTTRGYGWLDVNYRGSTGYGRSYMLALRHKWGLLDVEDAVGGAQALSALKLADPKRLVIMGGSAGGYTVLNVLTRHAGVFKAGVCLYGLSNLFITETHKFEERYNDSLIGVLPQDAERYRAWSPVYFADRIKDPVAVFQGAEDKVVPPEHSEQIVAALRASHVPHIYKVYEGEGHGWRRTETIAAYYDTVDKFLQQYVLFA
jgi:dipeptidyl aminopeptidase/acylaminoacyl peptidase